MSQQILQGKIRFQHCTPFVEEPRTRMEAWSHNIARNRLLLLSRPGAMAPVWWWLSRRNDPTMEMSRPSPMHLSCTCHAHGMHHFILVQIGNQWHAILNRPHGHNTIGKIEKSINRLRPHSGTLRSSRLKTYGRKVQVTRDENKDVDFQCQGIAPWFFLALKIAAIWMW